MGLVQVFENWLFTRALKKAAIVVAQAVASYTLAHSGAINSWGVTFALDPEMLTAALLASSEVLRNFLKQKVPGIFGWL